MTGDDRGYGVARLALIDAVRALSEFAAGSVVLIGAHAVYHHSPTAVASLSPFTLDGDLAADPRRVRMPRAIYDSMEQGGFRLRGQMAGLYELRNAPVNEKYAAQVDILVPASLEHQWEFEGYDWRGSRATLSQPGLELCLIDHSMMTLAPVGSLSAERVDAVEVEVAGIFALLVAKGYKIGERYAQGPDAFSLVHKDIADIYRLLRVADFAEIATKTRALTSELNARAVAEEGASHVHGLCGANGPGCHLLQRQLGESEEANIIIASLETLADEFYDSVVTALRTTDSSVGRAIE